MMRKLKKGLLIVISGPSGAGKGTIIKEIKNLIPEVAYSVSVTTRAPREGEVDGKDYFFRTYEQFKQMMHENAFLETAEVYGNYYGTPKSYVDKLMKEGKDVILEIDTVGAKNVKKQYPEAVLIFIAPPTAKDLAARLSKRGTESTSVMNKRLQASSKEFQSINNYDFIIVNDEIKDAVQELYSIVNAMHCSVSRNGSLIKKYQGGN